MDSQLRTRLIGAAVLVGLAVIFLPMLLESDAEPQTSGATEEIPLDIPEPGAEGLQTRTLPIRDEAPLVEIDATAPDPIARVDTARAPAPVRRLASEDQAALEAQQESEGQNNAAQSVAESSPATSSVPRNESPAPQASEGSSPSSPAAAPVTSPVVPATSSSGQFGVNFGSYGALANAENLITQLAAVKVKASVEPVSANGKSLFRVASRGYASRAAAETARLAATTGINGLNASILEGELPNDTAPTTVVAPSVQSFAVQIGVFADQAKAKDLITQLRGKGFAAFSEQVLTASGSSTRIRVGPMIKRADADSAKTDIKAKLGLDGIVLPYP
jgi:DedD protein